MALIETFHKSQIMLTDRWKGKIVTGDRLYVSKFNYLTTDVTEDFAGIAVNEPAEYPSGNPDDSILGTFVTFNSSRSIEGWENILF